MALVNLLLNTPLSKASFDAVCNVSVNGPAAANNLAAFLVGTAGGVRSTALVIQDGAVQATATITSTGAATAAQTLTIANVVLTAVASGAVADQFVVSGTVATQAANIAACINASTGLAGIVTATALLGVVTVTAVVGGKSGNGLGLTETLSNVTATAFASGSNGTAYSYQLG